MKDNQLNFLRLFASFLVLYGHGIILAGGGFLPQY